MVGRAVLVADHLTAILELSIFKGLLEIPLLQVGIPLGLVLQTLLEMLVVQLKLNFNLQYNSLYLDVFANFALKLLEFCLVGAGYECLIDELESGVKRLR